MPSLYRLDIPPHIANVIRSLPPDLKRSVRAAIDAIAARPDSGESLQGELSGYRKFRVRRFRIVYAVDKRRRMIRLVAVGHRRNVYEELASEVAKRRD